MKYDYYFLTKIFIYIFYIVIFYHYIKLIVMNYSGKLASCCKLTRYYPYEVAKGVIELPGIVFAHFLFCYFMIRASDLRFSQLGWSSANNLWLVFYGVFLGLGIMGTSSLLGRFYIEICRYFSPRKFPQDIKNWLAMGRSGWIRHHFHTLQVLPVPLALSVTFGQVCAEECVFRGILINYFLPYGKITALLISTLLFMGMQLFHMPNRIGSGFPVIGALVMGGVGGILYLQVHTLIPLIIAHITFFAVAVL